MAPKVMLQNCVAEQPINRRCGLLKVVFFCLTLAEVSFIKVPRPKNRSGEVRKVFIDFILIGTRFTK